MDMKAINRAVIEQFRAGGEVEGMQREILTLLTTKGRKSGEARTAPMMFNRIDDQLVVVASNAGAAEPPEWYLNLIEHPSVTVELPDQTFEAVAEPAEGASREALWSELKARYPFFIEHEQKAGREIPVVVLKRI